jgi:hypothetical protein
MPIRAATRACAAWQSGTSPRNRCLTGSCRLQTQPAFAHAGSAQRRFRAGARLDVEKQARHFEHALAHCRRRRSAAFIAARARRGRHAEELQRVQVDAAVHLARQHGRGEGGEPSICGQAQQPRCARHQDRTLGAAKCPGHQTMTRPMQRQTRSRPPPLPAQAPPSRLTARSPWHAPPVQHRFTNRTRPASSLAPATCPGRSCRNASLPLPRTQRCSTPGADTDGAPTRPGKSLPGTRQDLGHGCTFEARMGCPWQTRLPKHKRSAAKHAVLPCKLVAERARNSWPDSNPDTVMHAPRLLPGACPDRKISYPPPFEPLTARRAYTFMGWRSSSLPPPGA